MKKTYTYFTFKDLNGEEFSVACHTTPNYEGFKHYATTYLGEQKVYASQQWCNRTWESFDYESALRNLADKIEKKWNRDLGEYMKVQIKAIAQHEHEKAEAWFNNYKARYDALGDKTKKHLANTGVVLTSQEQAENVMAISEAFDTMFKLMGE